MSSTTVPVTVNDETFERWVLDSPQPVAVLFCTPRFTRCQQILPLWRDMAREYGARLRVAQITVDDNRRWARHFGITALPAILWIRDGEVVQRSEGVPDVAELRERATALLEGREPGLPESPKAHGLSSAEGPVRLTDATFDEALKADKPVLVDFWAAWCGPCRMVAPVVEQLARELGERALIAKVNVDENQQTAGRYGIRSIPTLLIFKGGKVVDTLVGAQPGPVIRQRLLRHVDG